MQNCVEESYLLVESILHLIQINSQVPLSQLVHFLKSSNKILIPFHKFKYTYIYTRAKSLMSLPRLSGRCSVFKKVEDDKS